MSFFLGKIYLKKGRKVTMFFYRLKTNYIMQVVDNIINFKYSSKCRREGEKVLKVSFVKYYNNISSH